MEPGKPLKTQLATNTIISDEPRPARTGVPVFNRISQDRVHPYEHALLQMLEGSKDPKNSLDIENAMIARNICHDHRVSLEREEQLHTFTSKIDGSHGPLSGKLLRRTAEDYFLTRVRMRSSPDFVVAELNEGNFLLDIESPDPDELLVRVFDLNGIGKVYRQASNDARWKNVFDGVDLNDHNLGSWDIAAWLERKLTRPDEREERRVRRAFVQATLEALNDDFARQPFQPVWVTKWKDFNNAVRTKPNAESSPSRWLEVTGVATASDRTWQMLLVYPAREVLPNPIVRPTVLDGRPNAYHFPSPPEAKLRVGGHPVDLIVGESERNLIPEYIHQQIRLDITFWEAGGEFLGCTNGRIGADLRNARMAHHKLLTHHYPGTPNWMPEPC